MLNLREVDSHGEYVVRKEMGLDLCRWGRREPLEDRDVAMVAKVYDRLGRSFRVSSRT
jgi:hypothetical protein